MIIDYVKKALLLFVAICVISLSLTNCKENAIINNKQRVNSYTFYPNGQLRSIAISYANHYDTFYITKDGELKNWGKLFKIVSRDSILIEKQLRALLEAETFSGVLLNLQIRILDSLQHIIWDSTVVIKPPKGHGYEVFPLKKALTVPGLYQCNVLYKYVDSTTKKVLYSDSAKMKIAMFEKNK